MEHLPPTGEGNHTEIAFFGGSFTAIAPAYMEELLQAAAPFVEKGRAKGIRISTRPDAIDDAVLALLGRYGVTSIELGAQSMNDAVLEKNRRGHTAADVRRAAGLIKAAGFELGLQMMVGLPGGGSAQADAMATAAAFAALEPATVRVYPTLMLQDTELADWYAQGLYKPLTVEEAVPICAALLEFFAAAGTKVIRLGLHADAGLEKSLLAGPYHPALRQLCQSYIYEKKLMAALQLMQTGTYMAVVAEGERSTFGGQKNATLHRMAQQGYILQVEESQGLEPGTFQLWHIPG